MEYRTLNIQGAILDTPQLEQYLEKVASDHIIQQNSSKDTYPIPRVKENFDIITDVYQLLNEHIKIGIPIHPAGEWILDNFYILEESTKMICKELTLKKYTNFLGIANGSNEGFARVFVLASEMIGYTDGKIDAKNLFCLLKAYQNKKKLSMEEIWNIGLFLQIALLEKVRGICEKIYSVQMQKYKVENILERLVENKEKNALKFKNNSKILGYGEMKYPFIEYMSYRLKQYGKKGYPFLTALEEQVNQMGTSVEDVIKKEHFDIAVRKISIGNCILSIKRLPRINLLEIFEDLNGVEDILKQDPQNIYDKMDFKTKEQYRNTIKNISKRTKISEIYIAQKALQLAQKQFDILQQTQNKTKEQIKIEEKKSHIGYYLIDEGKSELLSELMHKKVKSTSKKKKVACYLSTIWIIAIVISILVGLLAHKTYENLFVSILLAITIFIPIQTSIVQIVQYILGKIVPAKKIPKLDFQDGIPKEYATFVVIPTIIKSKEKVKDLIKKLEVFYLANKSENLYFALLGDCSCGKNQKEQWDNEVILEGKKQVEQLNEKYRDEEFPKFHFLYRKRDWNSKEEAYLGWERKRGLLTQFNEYILGNSYNVFLENTIEKNKKNLPNIKYIITLDADTDLSLHSGTDLVGTMAHILNVPIMNKQKDCVIEGHGLLQPRVGIDLNSSRKSKFTKLYSGSPGTDSYTNAISDTYQDNFDEGIFTGKGIYDLPVFSTILKNEIPDNKVLSHDLLEGSYLRCGLATDIMLMDGYPTTYSSYRVRQHRWIRGDYQIICWLKRKIKNREGQKKKNPLNRLSRYKILDNLIRATSEIFLIISFIIIAFMAIVYEKNTIGITTILIICAIMPSLLEIINRILYRKEGEQGQRTFTKNYTGVKSSFLRAIINFSVLPDKAQFSLNAIVKTLYRVIKSKKHLLEWTTSEEAEKSTKNDLLSYYTIMQTNVVLGIVGITMAFFIHNISGLIIGIISSLWLIGPMIAYEISKIEPETDKLEELSKQEQEYIKEVANKTWRFFKEHLNKENNYLIPDNYQEERKQKVVKNTSPTNIGLSMLAVISAYDLGFENLQDTLKLLENIIESIAKLPKWNGHLYNWYQIETLKPLTPRYISSVDSGNFVGYLYVVKQFLLSQDSNFVPIVEKLIQDTDFKPLYNEENNLFSIGFNVETNTRTDSYYDLLASEARQASIVAIAKKDVSSKHWYNLSRTLTNLNKYKGLISWSGTAFEYLMPNINIPKYPSSLLEESSQFMIMSQKEYSKKLGIPWGISESAFSVKDLNGNYQYKAFGIPWLGLKRGLADEMVVAPYGSILAIPEKPKEVFQNLKQLEKQGMYQQYGFYEAIDYTPNRLPKGKEHVLVKTYMAHHQGLILLSINNLFHQNILQKRFMENPEIKAIDILLQEKMPEKIILTKEQKEKVEKIKYKQNEGYTQRSYSKITPEDDAINVISNENYTIVMNQKGEGYSKYLDRLINRYKPTADETQGIFFYIKNIKNNRIWSNGKPSYLADADKYQIDFAPDHNEIRRMDGDLETVTKITIAPNEPVELRQISIFNHGNDNETLEITSFLEPVLSLKEQDYAHTAFNNLFLSYEYYEETGAILVKRKKRQEHEKDFYLAVSLYTEQDIMGELEYEIDKEKFTGRGNLGLPKVVETSTPLSKKMGLTTDPIIAMKRTLMVKPKEKIDCYLIISVGEEKQEVLKLIENYQNSEKIKRSIELSRARVEEESRYLGVTGKQIETYQTILGYLIFQNTLPKLQQIDFNNKYPPSCLWQYGISGDYPILLVRIQDSNDLYFIEELLKAYAYFRVKNISIDLVILNEETESYENYVKEGIQSAILNQNLGYMQNVKGGIYVLEHVEDKNALLIRSNLVLNAHSGDMSRQLNELKEQSLENKKIIGDQVRKQQMLIEEPQTVNELEKYELKYYNEYGGFSADGKEYLIRVNRDNKTPTVWSHIIANEKFGSIVTEGMGGYTWSKNCRINRMTAWANNPIIDVPSEIIYLREEETGKAWSLGVNPMPDEKDYYITYGLGYAKYAHTSQGIIQELDVFIPKEDSVKVNLLHLKNTEPKRKRLTLFYYLKPVLGEDEIKSNGYITLEYKENSNILCAKNLTTEKQSIMYVSSSEKISSYTGNKQMWIGSGNISNPEGIKKVSLDEENSFGKDSVVVLELEIELEAFGSKTISLILGEEENEVICQDMAYQYNNINRCQTEYNNIKRYWTELVGKIQVKTPVESMNILLNGWIIYQTMCARLWARSGYYQSGGAFGFRDQLQDTIALKYMNSEFMKNQIIKHASHQFIEGDVEHWWHEETNRGIRTRFSDDLLWLAWITADYIKYTGDDSILDINVPYRKGEILQEGVDEIYDYHAETEEKEPIFMHCIRAIEKSINFGENGLPKIGSGDWNDGFSTVGNKGKGESVWLGFFFYDVLKQFIPICQKKLDEDRVRRYEEVLEQLRKALNNKGWDGRWYKRAFMDNGDVLGTLQNEECRIDSIAQSWATISGAGDNDKKYISMESLENHLVDKENGIIKLLDPPFEKSKLEPGYIKSYLPGTRENGGQYTHECCTY